MKNQQKKKDMQTSNKTERHEPNSKYLTANQQGNGPQEERSAKTDHSRAGQQQDSSGNSYKLLRNFPTQQIQYRMC